MDGLQQGGTSFSLQSLMTPNFVFFVVTLAIIGYLYQTRIILGRESEIKSQASNLFDKQMYLEIGFMILIGFCIYIFNCNDNTTFVWIYILAPIIYLMVKGLLVFSKVTDYIEKSPERVDINTDIVDLLNNNNNNNNNNINNNNNNNNIGQIPVTNQNSNTVQITNALNQALGMNNNMNPPLGNSNRNNNIMSQQPMQPVQPPQPEGFSLF